MTTVSRVCGTCKYWTPPPMLSTKGLCHLRAPTVIENPDTGMAQTHFPAVAANDWCGEWEARTGPLPPPVTAPLTAPPIPNG